MRCKACNKQLASVQIQYNRMLGDFELCPVCMWEVRDVMQYWDAVDRNKEEKEHERLTSLGIPSTMSHVWK